MAEDDIINMVEQAVSKQSQGEWHGQAAHDKKDCLLVRDKYLVQDISLGGTT